MNASFKGNVSFMNPQSSPFMLRPKTLVAPSGGHTAPSAAAKDAVLFGTHHTQELHSIDDNRTLNFPGTLDLFDSGRIGDVTAGQNVWLNEVTAYGNITAQHGEIQSIASNIHGILKAPRDIEATKTDTLKGIEAGGYVDTDDIHVKGDVISENADINFIKSAATGKLIAPKGEVWVENDKSEEVRGVGGIEAGKRVTAVDAGHIKGKIIAGGQVNLAGDTTAHGDIVVHGSPDTIPTVNIGKGVTVKGNIKFENGNGQVNYEKGAKLLGKTINGQQSEFERLEKRDINYCDPKKVDFKDDDCDPTISESHNPFNLTSQQLSSASPCPNSGPSRPSFKTGLMIAGLLIPPMVQHLFGRR